MTELLSRISASGGLDLISMITSFVAIVAALSLTRDIVYGLRAKQRAFYEMQKASQEAQFIKLARSVVGTDSDVSAADVEKLKLAIEQHLADMSERDRKIVHQGLYQSSRSGSERYIRDIIGRRVDEAA